MGGNLKVADTAPGLKTSRLYPLADALGITLTLDGIPKTKIRGSGVIKLPVPLIDLVLDIDVRVLSSFVDITGEDVGLLMKLRGDLHMLMFHSEFMKVLDVHLIDVNKLDKNLLPMGNMLERELVRSYSGAMKRLTPGVVASFEREEKASVWRPMKEPRRTN